MPVTYFVSYNVQHPEGPGVRSGFGNMTFTLKEKITGIDQVQEISKKIEKHHNYPHMSVVTLNFIELPKGE
jgi:hypothetical protein